MADLKRVKRASPELRWLWGLRRLRSKVTNISERLKTPESPGLFRTQEVEHFPRAWDLTRLRLKHLKISWPDWLRTYRHAQIDFFNYTEMKCHPETRLYPCIPDDHAFALKPAQTKQQHGCLFSGFFFSFSVPSVSLFDFPFNEEGFNEPSVCFRSSIYTPGRSCSLVCCTDAHAALTVLLYYTCLLTIRKWQI